MSMTSLPPFDYLCIAVSEWQIVGGQVLASTMSMTAPIKSNREESILNKLAPDYSVITRLETRKAQGRGYIVDACGVIFAPLTITPFYAQNEAMWNLGIYDMLIRENKTSALIHYNKRSAGYVVEGPEVLSAQHLPPNMNVRLEECIGDASYYCCEDHLINGTSAMDFVCIDVNLNSISAAIFALKNLADGGSILISLVSLRDHSSMVILGAFEKSFQKVLISYPKAVAMSNERVYVYGLNVKTTAQCIATILKSRLREVDAMCEMMIPEEFSCAVRYWSLRIFQLAQKKYLDILDLCSKIIIHSPLVRAERLHTLVFMCIQAAQRNGIFIKYRQTYQLGCHGTCSVTAMENLMNLVDGLNGGSGSMMIDDY